MRVLRLDIDEGFLDGLAVEFSAGLNVLIGARGVGKTSVIEILRFVLGAEWFTSEARARGEQQVRSVLGGGLARVTLTDGDEEIVVMRGGRDERPRATGAIPTVMVLAQNEIEAVGAQATGRLALLDRFRASSDEENAVATAIVTKLRSLSDELHHHWLTRDAIRDELVEFGEVDAELERAKAEQAEVLDSVRATDVQQAELRRLQATSGSIAGKREQTRAADGLSQALAVALQHAQEAAKEADGGLREMTTDSDLEAAHNAIRQTVPLLDQAAEAVATARAQIRMQFDLLDRRQIEVDQEARDLRAVLDSIQAGLGEVAGTVEALSEKAARRQALEGRLRIIDEAAAAISSSRRDVYGDLEELRDLRFGRRESVARRLNDQLSPAIRLDVSRGAARGGFANALVAALKGSGLHYNRLAPKLAERLSPLELIEAVEAGDSTTVGELAGLAPDRADSMVAWLRTQPLGPVLTAPINDATDLYLLDGGDYKPANHLSIGQRCTAVLPILLSGDSEILIVDQPEDHLDNAFISGTLVNTLKSRSPQAQFIFASHNANIPVLGEADRVIHLGSDGRRGFVLHQGELTHPNSVSAVTSVMEGGAAAFAQRADFYRVNSAPDG